VSWSPDPAGEEDGGLLPEHHPQRSARDRLISDAHLEDSGR